MYKLLRGLLTAILIAAAFLFTGVFSALMDLIPPAMDVFIFLASGAIIVYFVCLIVDALGSTKND